MLKSTEHEVSNAEKSKLLQIKMFPVLKLSDTACILLIIFKMPTIVGISTFISMTKFTLSWVEHENNGEIGIAIF